jgi:hypothetical protein
MSIFNAVELAVLPFVLRVQDMIGRVIYDYTGIMTSDLVNQVVFYFVGSFMLYLVWLLIKPSESVYHYRAQHRH